MNIKAAERRKIGIDNFFSPITSDQFLQGYWPHRVLVKHSNIPSPFEIGKLANIRSFENLLPLIDQAPPGRISFLAYPMQARRNFRQVERSEVEEIWKQGASFCIYGFHLLDACLIRGLIQFEKDLGVLSNGSFCCGYVSSKDEIVPMHMDFTDSFVFQLVGTKQWTIAPNEHLKYSHVAWTKGLPIPKGFGLNSLPTKMPSTKQTFELKPGSVLYVPRGHWHATLATSMSISITFSLRAWTWRDLILDELASRLLSFEEYREPIPGVGPFDKNRLRIIKSRLEKLSRKLRDDLPGGTEMQKHLGKLLRASRKAKSA